MTNVVEDARRRFNTEPGPCRLSRFDATVLSFETRADHVRRIRDEFEELIANVEARAEELGIAEEPRR
ncbi:MAG: hypothetical protein ACHQPI_02865 [Thermoanaerobaculia bacterium]